MRHLKTYESFYKSSSLDFDAIYSKSDALIELETNLTDILDDVKVDGFEWIGYSTEAGSFGITSIDINIFLPLGEDVFPGKARPFRFKEIEGAISHLHSYLTELGFKLSHVNIVIAGKTSYTEPSINLANNTFSGITYPALLTAFTDDGQAKRGKEANDIRVLKLSFKK